MSRTSSSIILPASVILIILLISCGSNSEETVLQTFEAYFKAANKGSDQKWNYTSDTVMVWFDSRESDPVIQTREEGSTGIWQEWDEEMHAASYYDSLWYDADERMIQGYFYENNDFYELIGKPPTKTLRSYWLNEDLKISEILIYWIPEENTTTSQHLDPIVSWAYKNDSALMNEIYPEKRIIPSRENAKRWKKLIEEFRNTGK